MRSFFLRMIVSIVVVVMLLPHYGEGSTNTQPLDTPILLVIFNRVDKQQRVFDQIRKVQPKQLFIAADGPRAHVADDKRKCEEARKIVNHIDWPCEVKTFFRDKNVGVDVNVVGAINWMFSYVDNGIILEDDCYPSVDFFYFCEQMLVRYQDDERVGTVCGLRLSEAPFRQQNGQPYSYFFSNPHIFHWGWATWKRAWKFYDNEMSLYDLFRERSLGKNIYSDQRLLNHNSGIWSSVRGRIKGNKNDPHLWDVRYCFSAACHGSLTIFPTANLVENIGFDSSATHTKSGRQEWKKKIESMDVFNLKHPPYVLPVG